MGLNMLGVDVSTLDVSAFLRAARVAFPALALLWLIVLLKLKRPGWLALGVVAANAWAWGVTNYPLQRVYALGPSHDRIGNLGLAQVVAAGNSPLHTTQVGQLHFEPFWGLVVAAASGFDTDRVLALYPFLPLVMLTAFPVALYFGLKGPCRGEGLGAWERALLVGFATLLSSAPLDYVGPHRVPWAKMFLLKPNHALGLVLLPLFLAAFVRIRSIRGRLGVGVLLHLMGWAFVLHMAYVCVGLVLFLAVTLALRREELRRDLTDVVTVIGVNLLVVSPYLVMLLVGYPFLVRSEGYALPAWSPHLLEPTLRTGVLIWLGLWGVIVLARRGDRMSRLLLGQIAGGFLVWVGYVALGWVGLARERDEIYFWLRILTAASAAVGCWDLVRRAASFGIGATWDPARRAAAVSLLALPFALPTWWDPARMDAYFTPCLEPLPVSIRQMGDFLRRHTEPQAVVAGDPSMTRYAAALAGRRALVSQGMNVTKDWKDRQAFQKDVVAGPDSLSVMARAARWGVRYVLVTPSYLAGHGVTLHDLGRRHHLQPIYLAGDPAGDFVAVYRMSAP